MVRKNPERQHFGVLCLLTIHFGRIMLPFRIKEVLKILNHYL